jgi:PII-like signaling protein
MKTIEVTMVRIYLTEGEGIVKNLLKRLHDWEKVKGVTVFRGISGFGGSGVVHTSVAVDLMMDLPVVVEFFDEPKKVESILEHINTMLDPGHIITWSARMSDGET